MQTFLTHESFKEIAQALDYKRLGKQRVECLQILQVNNKYAEHKSKYGDISTPTLAWKNHPAVLMWRNYDALLCMYASAMCEEWIRRGYEDNLKDKFDSGFLKNEFLIPYWWASPTHKERIITTHRGMLIQKDPDFYSTIFPNTPLPTSGYYWPKYSKPSSSIPIPV